MKAHASRRNAVTFDQELVERPSNYHFASFRDSGHAEAISFGIRAFPSAEMELKAEKQRETQWNATVSQP